ncbi:MAG: hypothetical protein U0871_17765 [Gemmataceae bacterium]
MTARPPRPVPMPTPVDAGLPFSVGVAYYRTDYERAFYLRALRHVSDGRLVVVLGLRAGSQVDPADLPDNVRLIQTGAGLPNPAERVGWFVPDPLQAVVVGMTGRLPGEGLILLFPDDWAGDSPDALVDAARRWRAGPHSPEDDVYFNAAHPN